MVPVTWGSDLIAGPVNRVVATMQNGVEVLRFGGLQTGSRPSPFQTVERCDIYRLRRYFHDSANDPSRPPVILVPPMMMSANVFDVTRDQGAVGVLHDLGVDPWVVDFGSPDRETGNEFSGQIDWVQIDIGDDSHNHLIKPEDRLTVAMARQ